jgi:hypothetical protein
LLDYLPHGWDSISKSNSVQDDFDSAQFHWGEYVLRFVRSRLPVGDDTDSGYIWPLGHAGWVGVGRVLRGGHVGWARKENGFGPKPRGN